MKLKHLSAMVVAVLLLTPGLAGAADEPSAAAKELRELVTKIQTKLRAGDKTEEKLADELKGFDALLAKYKDEKTDDVAQILFMQAQLYS